MFDRIEDRKEGLVEVLRNATTVSEVVENEGDVILVSYTDAWDVMPSEVSETVAAYGYVPFGSIKGATRLRPIEDIRDWE